MLNSLKAYRSLRAAQRVRQLYTSCLIGGAVFLLPVVGQTAPVVTPPTLSNQADVASESPLMVVEGDGVIRASGGAGVWNAGLVDPSRTPTIMQTFVLRNTSAQSVLIDHLRAACGCTSLLLVDDGVSGSTVTLKPGVDTKIRVTLRLQGQPPGDTFKYAWVYGPGDVTLATLAINLTVRPSADITPSYVDFGTVSQGTSRTVMVTVTVDNAVLIAGSFPALTCTNKAIEVIASGIRRPATRDGQPSLTQDFEVTLKPTSPAGSVGGRLLLHGASATTSDDASTLPGELPLPLFDVVGHVGGRVTGKLAATPQSVFFGSIQSGKDATREVVLSLTNATSTHDISFSSSSPWLAAKLLPENAGPLGMRVLSVTLASGTPSGQFQAQIIIKDNAGEELIIPVSADLSPVIKPAH